MAEVASISVSENEVECLSIEWFVAFTTHIQKPSPNQYKLCDRDSTSQPKAGRPKKLRPGSFTPLKKPESSNKTPKSLRPGSFTRSMSLSHKRLLSVDNHIQNIYQINLDYVRERERLDFTDQPQRKNQKTFTARFVHFLNEVESLSPLNGFCLSTLPPQDST